jgi:hypothetical protein
MTKSATALRRRRLNIRLLATLALTFIAWRVCVEFMAVPGALGVAIAAGVVTWLVVGLLVPAP